MAFKLPEKFERRMKELLGAEFEPFEKGYETEHAAGLRINTMKLSADEFQKLAPVPIRKIPWISNGFYYDADAAQPAKHPYYFAGLYYIQEPSAMTPAAVLPVEPGDRVLDLCAAPGGKSTELAAKLRGEGVLVSNDISNSRAKALLKNLELFGTRNAVIVSEPPAKLAERFTGYFDKILVDAPCSGEGMFRKSPAIMKNWEQYGVEYYRKLQREILPSAVKMLRPGGMLLYSTCTFSPEEDEDTLAFLLREYPELSMAEPALSYEGFAPGRPEWVNGPEEIKKAIRIWPHRMEGEGHFVALLQKSGEAKEEMQSAEQPCPAKLSEEAKEFLERLSVRFAPERIISREERLYYLPEGLPQLGGLRILRSGLLLGEMKKNRFEPSQALACALKAEEYDNCYSLPAEDADIIRYLKCETITAKEPVRDGFVLVCADGYPLGWGKASNGVIKNKYLAGWRMM
ncbi:MAG: RsmB/NOP family class I SAM-dependent RNA methyltransferase [Lachnospiraceae bacterium]|nr:RsmB/NOP family class I SAM-dependent RNA methyltransferase [Lachnospiraceae bacterium]